MDYLSHCINKKIRGDKFYNDVNRYPLIQIALHSF